MLERRNDSWRASRRWWERQRRSICRASSWVVAPAIPLPTFDDLTGSNTFRYAVGPVVSLPLNWGRIKANVDITKAQADEAQAQYTQTVLQALQDVETALSRYRTSRSRVERLREAAVASAAAAELARLRFSEGVTDFLQVLDAERTQLDAEDQLAQGRTDAATAYAALYKALGGSWPFPEATTNN